ncbi:MAG: diguanylate cyclase [Spirochaetes bacterium]|nr:diguanylate cyclase [Spirochaetota bacterium]MBN2770978.1 diguanylate cyclase [Spirochaetota bacterium]
MNKKIIVVDDDPVNRTLICSVLKKYTLFTAEDIKSMYNIIKENGLPDLILLDVMLPEVNGFEAARDLHTEFRNQDVGIIFVSARTEGSSVKEGFDSGGYDYIKKPFDSIELIARVENQLERIERENKLRSDASLDPLTAVYNRRYFKHLVEQKINFCNRKNMKLSIAMIDLDNFKEINDNFSHLAGDYVLQTFASQISESLRKYDLMGRFGGEEFIIAFVDCCKDCSYSIMERLRADVEKRAFIFEGNDISLSFSAGIADLCEIESRKSVYHEILKLSDQRLYEAKRLGRNQIVI